MPKLPQRHHALEKFLYHAVAGGEEEFGVEVETRPDLDYINLRGDPADGGFLDAVQNVLNQCLPLIANTMGDGASTVYWLGPDEWLLVTPKGLGPALVQSLVNALAKVHGSINVMSGGQITLRIGGPKSSALLAKGCTLDLHPRIFPSGNCAQTGLGKASVLIGKIDDKPTFDLVVRRSFAEYLALWLQHAGAEYGIVFSTDK